MGTRLASPPGARRGAFWKKERRASEESRRGGALYMRRLIDEHIAYDHICILYKWIGPSPRPGAAHPATIGGRSLIPPPFRSPEAARRGQEGAKTNQWVPRGSQDGARRPRVAQDSPRWPQDAPKRLRDVPRGLPEHSQEGSKRPKSLNSNRKTYIFSIYDFSAFTALKTVQEAPKTSPRQPKTSPRPVRKRTRVVAEMRVWL